MFSRDDVVFVRCKKCDIQFRKLYYNQVFCSQECKNLWFNSIKAKAMKLYREAENERAGKES